LLCTPSNVRRYSVRPSCRPLKIWCLCEPQRDFWVVRDQDYRIW
jgi:hypothetical protein